jgi:hypothetical protein
MRRRMIVAALAAALIAELVIGVVTVTRHRTHTAAPGRLLIGYPLDRMPVPGWRLTAAEIGVPSDVPIGQPIGTIGDHAYFFTGCDEECLQRRCDSTCDDPRGWLFGIDLRTGARLFKPVLMDGFRYSPLFRACHQNGPSMAVCVNNEFPKAGQSGLLWVLDLDRGVVTYSGKTDFWQDSVPGPGPNLLPVGNPRGQTRLVASVRGKGVYGVGPRAELTWFVPGSGHLVPAEVAVDDGTPVTLATQIPTAEDPRYRVFSVIDGTEKTPTPPPGTTLRRALAYAGGFAYQYEAGDTAGVLFYDPAGHLLARRELKGYNLMEATPVPIVLDAPMFRVYAPDGRQITTVPADFTSQAAPMFWAMGRELYSGPDREPEQQTWQQWNLDTGRSGSSCRPQVALTSYVGSDGRIVLLLDVRHGRVAVVAVDVATCQTLWRMPQPGRHKIDQLGTALVDVSPGELVSLRAP